MQSYAFHTTVVFARSWFFLHDSPWRYFYDRGICKIIDFASRACIISTLEDADFRPIFKNLNSIESIHAQTRPYYDTHYAKELRMIRPHVGN